MLNVREREIGWKKKQQEVGVQSRRLRVTSKVLRNANLEQLFKRNGIS